MKKLLPLAMLPLLALTACDDDMNGFSPVEVPFETHHSVLRGTYIGEIERGTATGKQLRLTFTPNYVNERVYSVTATGTLGDEEVTASGTVGGGLHRYLKAQMAPPPQTKLNFRLTRANGAEDEFNCYRSSGEMVTEMAAWVCHDKPDAENSEKLYGYLLAKQN